MHRAQGVPLSLRMLLRRRPREGAELLPRVPRLGAIGPDREAEASELAELQVLGGFSGGGRAGTPNCARELTRALVMNVNDLWR